MHDLQIALFPTTVSHVGLRHFGAPSKWKTWNGGLMWFVIVWKKPVDTPTLRFLRERWWLTHVFFFFWEPHFQSQTGPAWWPGLASAYRTHHVQVDILETGPGFRGIFERNLGKPTVAIGLWCCIKVNLSIVPYCEMATSAHHRQSYKVPTCPYNLQSAMVFLWICQFLNHSTSDETACGHRLGTSSCTVVCRSEAPGAEMGWCDLNITLNPDCWDSDESMSVAHSN